MILFIGATGKTGLDTARHLAGRGGSIRALVRNIDKAAELRQLGFELIAGDAGDPDSLSRALAGADVLFLSTTAEPRMVELHSAIVKAGQAAGVAHIVKVSAIGANPRAKFRFAAGHGESDRIIQQSGLRFTILRPAYFMQNYLGSAAAIALTGELQLPINTGAVALIDTRDIGRVAAEALANPANHTNQIYDLTGADSLTGLQMAETMSRVLGREIRFTSPDPVSFQQMLMSYNVPEWSAAGLVEMYGVFAKGYGAGTNDQVRRITGHEPIRFEDFLRQHAAAFAPAAAGRS